MGKILLFEVNLFQADAIARLCQRLGHVCTLVPPRDYLQMLGALTAVRPFQKNKIYEGPGLSAPMMVFAGLDSAALDRFLSEYKSAGLAPIPHKAVLTATNLQWNALQLFEDLEEHVALSSRKK